MGKINIGKVKEFIKGKGFIGALVLSISAIGISAYMAYDNTLSAVESQPAKLPDTSAGIVDNFVSGIEKEESTSSDVQVAKPQPEVSKPSESKEDKPANHFVAGTKKKMMPLDGEIINPYSNGELVKSETLGVWKTHDGIDIAAPWGSDVVCACEGVVKEIKDDPLWGITVAVDHRDGIVSYYYGMDKALNVKEGQDVEAGEIIGKTAEFDCEAKLEPHLHFAVKRDGKWCDPSEFVNS